LSKYCELKGVRPELLITGFGDNGTFGCGPDARFTIGTMRPAPRSKRVEPVMIRSVEVRIPLSRFFHFGKSMATPSALDLTT